MLFPHIASEGIEDAADEVGRGGGGGDDALFLQFESHVAFGSIKHPNCLHSASVVQEGPWRFIQRRSLFFSHLPKKPQSVSVSQRDPLALRELVQGLNQPQVHRFGSTSTHR